MAVTKTVLPLSKQTEIMTVEQRCRAAANRLKAAMDKGVSPDKIISKAAYRADVTPQSVVNYLGFKQNSINREPSTPNIVLAEIICDEVEKSLSALNC